MLSVPTRLILAFYGGWRRLRGFMRDGRNAASPSDNGNKNGNFNNGSDSQLPSACV
jgi:hypothetical protein